jgi:hypothetical protein
MPAATAVTNWISATVPIPSTLPASSWWARTWARRISMTDVVFSSTTPVRTKPPNVLTEMKSRMAASVPTVRATPWLADSGSTVTVCSGAGARIRATASGGRPSWLACSAPRLTCQAWATVASTSVSTRRRKRSSPSPLDVTTTAASAVPSSSAATAAVRSGEVTTVTRRLRTWPADCSAVSKPDGTGPATLTVAAVGPSFESARLSSAMPMMNTAMSAVKTKKALERSRWRISRWAISGTGAVIGRPPPAGTPRRARAART